LILSSYNSLTNKNAWKQLMDIAYTKRNDVLPNKVIKHYEYLYKIGALQDRIKHYIERVSTKINFDRSRGAFGTLYQPHVTLKTETPYF
jgi:hypothetical protein